MVMQQIVSELMQVSKGPVEPKKISREEYNQWARGFVFDGLRDQRYGQSFCNHFNIHDNILYYASTVDQADRYIRETYVK
jgi:hypothetical protein